jgi:GDP-4-dehydro-6-deoxy-D-mannose reductase
MKILVTGAAGFAGHYLLESLLNNGDDTIFAVSKDSHEQPKPEKLKWVKCDLLNPNAVNEAVNSIKPDQVYHLAAYSSPGDSFSHPMQAINDTSAMQINLFEACILADIQPRTLIVSSGQIYGKNNKLPIDESGEIDCNSPYAVAKLSQENLASYYSKRGFEIVTVRPFNHIGPGQRLGFIVSDLANQIAKAEHASGTTEIRVGNLSSKRDFTDVRDVVLAYVKLQQRGESGEVYNVCSGSSVSGQDILNMLISMAKCEISVAVDPDKMRPSDIADLYGDHSKLTKATGWEPQVKLEQTLAETLDYWRNKNLS